MGRPSCGREIIIAIAAVDAIDVNDGFKQFVIAVDSFAAINSPCNTFACMLKMELFDTAYST